MRESFSRAQVCGYFSIPRWWERVWTTDWDHPFAFVKSPTVSKWLLQRKAGRILPAKGTFGAGVGSGHGNHHRGGNRACSLLGKARAVSDGGMSSAFSGNFSHTDLVSFV